MDAQDGAGEHNGLHSLEKNGWQQLLQQLEDIRRRLRNH